MRNWLENARKSKGYTKSNLAKAVGLQISSIGKYERGEHRPSPEVAKKIGIVLDINWTRFFDEPE